MSWCLCGYFFRFIRVRRKLMKQEDELALKVTKEIVIKYIEIGRLSLNAFDDAFKQIHETVRGSIGGSSRSEKTKE